MKRAVWLMILAGCTTSPRGDALKVTLLTKSGRAETCFSLELRDRAGALLGETRFPREEDRTAYVSAVFRSGPADATLLARALVGVDCDVASRPNGVSEPLDVTFDPKRVLEVTLDLSGGDADGDGFVATAQGGLDCADDDRTVSPAAPEQCFGVVDHDCNGRSSCDDPACAGKPCAGAPHRLHFTEVPGTLRVGACGAVTLEVRDDQGRLTSAPAGAIVTPTGDFSFFTDALCAQPLTASALALEPTVHFAVRPSRVGALTLTASSLPLISATAEVIATVGEPAALRFPNPAVSAMAGRCSPEVVLAVFDDAGVATRARDLLSVTLASDAGSPFAFYVDDQCTSASSTLSIAPDAGGVSFWFSGQVAAPFMLTAASAPLEPAVQAALINPAGTASVVVTPPGGVVTTSSCTPAFIVSARDAFGNVVTPGQVSVSVPDAGATVFTGASCTTPGATDRFALIVTEEGTFTVTVTVDGVTATAPLTAAHAAPAGAMYRWPLTVTTGGRDPAGGYAGYTLQATFDTRDVVDAGLMDGDAGNLRVHFWTDAGWREVDRLVEGPNTAATRVRFASQTDLPTSSVTRRYSLFAGPWDGGDAPADPRVVYLFAEDFEDAGLSRWTVQSGAWQRATDRVHSGTGALKYPSEGTATHIIEAQPALQESDVMLEAWWNTSNPGNCDFAQMIRLRPGPLSYETNLEDNAGWSLAINAPGWSQLVGPQSPPTANTWMRIGLSMSGRDLRAWKNGVQVTPSSGAHTVSSPLDGGNIGFRKRDIGGSLWIDDVTVRRFTEPEPTVSVGPPSQ